MKRPSESGKVTSPDGSALPCRSRGRGTGSSRQPVNAPERRRRQPHAERLVERRSMSSPPSPSSGSRTRRAGGCPPAQAGGVVRRPARARNHDHGLALEPPQRKSEDAGRRLIEPLGVVDGDGHGLAGRQGSEQLEHRERDRERLDRFRRRRGSHEATSSAASLGGARSSSSASTRSPKRSLSPANGSPASAATGRVMTTRRPRPVAISTTRPTTPSWCRPRIACEEEPSRARLGAVEEFRYPRELVVAADDRHRVTSTTSKRQTDGE